MEYSKQRVCRKLTEMGKEEGTHEGADLGATPENDTQKIEQPDRRNPTTSN